MSFDLLLVYFYTFRDRSPLALTWYAEKLAPYCRNSFRFMFFRIQSIEGKIQYKTPRRFDLAIETKFMDMKSNQLIAVTSSVI